MKKYSLFSMLIIFVLFSQLAFSEIGFSSPLAGVWGNKQMLVIDGADDGEYYYSVDGADPETFGFAYDGPVLLDIEGDVSLKVVHYASDGTKDYGHVEYSVVTNDGFGKPYEDFLFSFLSTGYYDYNLEGGITIPSSLTFTLEKNPVNFVPGMDLSIAEDSILTQFVPCTICDNVGDVKWRFFIKTGPNKAGIFSKRAVPFRISQWDYISFISDDFIYRIDSEMWGQPEPDEAIFIDRSVAHTISWQSVNYKIGNTIESVVLPPKPEVKYEIREDGSGCFYIEGDESYCFSLVSEGNDWEEYRAESGGVGGVVAEEGKGLFEDGGVPEDGDGLFEDGVVSGDGDDLFEEQGEIESDDFYYPYKYTNEVSSPELFKKIVVDAFYGDKISGDITLGLYSNGIYQGDVEVSYEVDKLPPKSPVITSSAKTFYSRNSVELNITVDSDAELFVSVGDPFVIENTDVIYKPESPIFYNIPVSGYDSCGSNSFSTVFEPQEDNVVYYRVFAYCQKGDMKSAIVEYSVIVDQSSYYFDKNAVDSLGEGTLLNPFTSFDQCINEFKDIRSVSLRLKGDLIINKNYHLNSNLQIVNGGDGRIIFGPSGSIEAGGASLEIENCRIHKIPSQDVTLLVPFFKLNHGTLDINDCQISGDFSKNGSIIDAIDSIVNVNNSIVSVSADSYASFISSINSKVSITDSSVSVTGDTSVIISASEGNITIKNNKFFIMGNIGRIAELFGVTAKFEDNEFKAELYNVSRSVEPIFASKNTKLIENHNSEIGF